MPSKVKFPSLLRALDDLSLINIAPYPHTHPHRLEPLTLQVPLLSNNLASMPFPKLFPLPNGLPAGLARLTSAHLAYLTLETLASSPRSPP